MLNAGKGIRAKIRPETLFSMDPNAKLGFRFHKALPGARTEKSPSGFCIESLTNAFHNNC